VQAPLHQQFGLALPHQLHGLCCRRMAVRCVHEPKLPDVDAVACRDVANLRDWTDEDWCDQALRMGLDDAGKRCLVARMCDRCRHWIKVAAP